MTLRDHALPALAATCLFVAAPAFAFWGPSITPSGKVVTESRPVTAFTGVAMSLPGTLVLKQGPAESVSLEADDNLLPEIETVVEGGRLRLRFRDHKTSFRGHATIRVLVTAPKIDSISVAGSGDALAESLQSDHLDLAVAGSGNLRIARVDTSRLKATIAGSGDVRLAGKASEVSVKIAGSGDLDAGRLESRQATVSVAGSGNAVLWARETLTVSVAGSGDIRYYGDPAITRSVLGSGSLKRLGAAP